MQRQRLSLAVITFLAIFAVSLSPALLSAQEDYPEGGSGIQYRFYEGEITFGGGDKMLQPYLFTFEPDAFLPEYPYPEAMVVRVQSGSLAFRVGKEDLVIADPRGNPIPIITTLDGQFVSEKRQGFVTGTDGSDCTTLCALPPNETVLIQRGVTIYLPGDTLCFFCNISEDKAELIVFAAVPQGSAFSWTQLQNVQAQSGDGPRYFRSAELPGLGVGCRA